MGRRLYTKLEPVDQQGICVKCDLRPQASRSPGSTGQFATLATEQGTTKGSLTKIIKRSTVRYVPSLLYIRANLM